MTNPKKIIPKEEIQEIRESLEIHTSHASKWGYYYDYDPLLDTIEALYNERDNLLTAIREIHDQAVIVEWESSDWAELQERMAEIRRLSTLIGDNDATAKSD